MALHSSILTVVPTQAIYLRTTTASRMQQHSYQPLDLDDFTPPTKKPQGKVRRAARKPVVQGMVAGASVGGLIGLGALPFAPIAVPGLVVAGAVVGTAVGGTVSLAKKVRRKRLEARGVLVVDGVRYLVPEEYDSDFSEDEEAPEKAKLAETKPVEMKGPLYPQEDPRKSIRV